MDHPHTALRGCLGCPLKWGRVSCPVCKILGPELATVGKDSATYLDSSIKALLRVGLMYDIVT
jgi:hypothetical protein